MKDNNQDKHRNMLLLMAISPIVIMIILVSFIVAKERQMVKTQYNLYDGEAEETYMLFDKVLLLNAYTRDNFDKIESMAEINANQLQDNAVLEKLNEELKQKYSFLMIEENGKYVYCGSDEYKELLINKLDGRLFASETGDATFIGDEKRPFLFKRIHFHTMKKEEANAYIITKMDIALPHIQFLTRCIVITLILIIIIMSIAIYGYAYYYIVKPIRKLQYVVTSIGEGDLDIDIVTDTNSEFSGLYKDVDKMRLQLKDLLEDLQKSDRMTREVIGNISHDLKTPLTAIKGYAEGVLDGLVSTPERLEKYMRTIYTKAVDMTGLIDELAFFTKINSKDVFYSFVNVNATKYFGDSVSDLTLDLELKGISLIFQTYLDTSVQVTIDVEKMKRVINNIVGNAAKYIPHKEGIILVRLTENENQVIVRVEDNGKGIEQEELPYIFERFYRTDSSRNSKTGGSGLGLAITKKIVEDHGGEIWAESKPGVGTAISFKIDKTKRMPKKEDIQNE